MATCDVKKRCPCCRQRKSLHSFNKNKSRKDGFSVWCRICNTAYTTSDQGRKTKHLRDKAALKIRQQFMYQLKSYGCCICGYSKCIEALDFHHVIPSTKSFGLREGAFRYYTNEQIINEFYKCMLLCSNCHRELHAKERGN